MFWLLSVLLALHLSSKGDGALGIAKVEDGRNIAADHETNRLDLLSGEANAEKKNVSAFTKNTMRLPGPQEDTQTFETVSTLEVRKLGESIPEKKSFFTGKKTKTANSTKTTLTTEEIKRSKGNDSRTLDNSNDEPANTQGKKRPSSKGVKETSAQKKKKEQAQSTVNKVRTILSNRGTSPYKDKKLAQLIETAILQYNKAYDREWSTLEELDKAANEARIKTMIKEIKGIFVDLDTRNESITKLESPSGAAEQRQPRAAPRPLAQETLSTKEKRDFATNIVKKVIKILENPDVDPHEDEGFAQLIRTAIWLYNKAYERKGLRPPKIAEDDNESRVTFLIKEIKLIFKDLNSRDESAGQQGPPSAPAKSKHDPSSKNRPTDRNKSKF